MSGSLARRLAARDEQRFVGREPELEFFDRILVADPPASVILVHGPGGIGKSTLLREVARRGERRGFTPRLIDGRDLAPAPGEIERAVDGLHRAEQPLLLFDTYERMSAAGGYLRDRLLPSLPERAVVVLAGRGSPDAAWMQGGWERVSVELELGPLGHTDSLALMAGYGLPGGQDAERLVEWAEGSPLALSLAAGASQSGAPLGIPGAGEPNLMRTILRRVAETELDGGNFDVAAIAAIARVTDARMLADVLPEVDAAEAETWLRSRTFAEPSGSGVTLHELVRRALRADLRATDPRREARLRCAIADHLHARATRGEPRLVTDLAELVENPALRWGFGAEGSVRHRVDAARPGDATEARELVVERAGDDWWWERMRVFFDQAPDRVIVVRDAAGKLCGVCIAVSPQSAPAAAEDDIVLGPWLAHAREHHAGDEVLLWRDAIDFSAPATGDVGSQVLSVMTTAGLLRSGLANPRFSYLPIDPRNHTAARFAADAGAEHHPELDVRHRDRVVECHVLAHGDGGMLGGIRDAIHAEAGALSPASGAEGPFTVDDVREALRNLERPMDLAASPLARGATPDERAQSVRRAIDAGLQGAFGTAHDEVLMRRILERAYLRPAPSHELAAGELNVSRATYFRRLRAASQQLADYLLATRGA
jgi:hypothetical protein